MSITLITFAQIKLITKIGVKTQLLFCIGCSVKEDRILEWSIEVISTITIFIMF